MTSARRRTARGLLTIVTDAVRSVIAPAALVADQAPAVEAAGPADVFTAEEMPPAETIESAARGYDLASDNARAADRAKRKHRRLLDHLPAGQYGSWIVERVASNKTTPDLVAIRAIFEQHQLGEVPMRRVAASLKVRRVEIAPADIAELAEVAA
jgi:hypothetical protein